MLRVLLAAALAYASYILMMQRVDVKAEVLTQITWSETSLTRGRL